MRSYPGTTGVRSIVVLWLRVTEKILNYPFENQALLHCTKCRGKRFHVLTFHFKEFHRNDSIIAFQELGMSSPVQHLCYSMWMFDLWLPWVCYGYFAFSFGFVNVSTRECPLMLKTAQSADRRNFGI